MLTIDLFEELEGPPEPTLIDALRDFLPIAVKHLKIKELPKIKLVDEVETDHMPSFGKFSNDDRTVHLGIKNRHPNDVLRTLAHEMVHYAQGCRDELSADSWHTGSPEEDQANAEAGVIMREFNEQFPQYMELKPIMLEKWSKKYKKSINCSNPKGFSQKAHCAGRKKNTNEAEGSLEESVISKFKKYFRELKSLPGFVEEYKKISNNKELLKTILSDIQKTGASSDNIVSILKHRIPNDSFVAEELDDKIAKWWTDLMHLIGLFALFYGKGETLEDRLWGFWLFIMIGAIGSLYSWMKKNSQRSERNNNLEKYNWHTKAAQMATDDKEEEKHLKLAKEYFKLAQPKESVEQGVTEGSNKECPPATQDITLNLKNRQKAINEYGYGPLNPDLPNTKFWMKKVDEWNLDSPEEAKSSLCGNCAAFDQREDTLDCISQGIGSELGADDPTIDAGDLGYCRFLKFKCASRRTCDAWVTGGPLTEGKHCDAKNAVPELKVALTKRKTELKNADTKVAYDKIDKIMTRIAQTYKISGQKLHDLWTERYGEIPDTWVLDENFADGKGPGKPGDSQRHGIPKGATIAQLEKASKAPGRKGQLARWQINMRRGKKK